MQITADFVNEPKPGKKLGTVKSGDTYYYFDPKKFSFNKGQTYEVDVKHDEYEGKTYTHILSVKKSASSEQQSNQINNQGRSGGSDRWWMPFVSNTVAHAIAAGKVEGPADVAAWARAARSAAMDLDSPQEPDDF